MESAQQTLADIRSGDKDLQGRAFDTLIEATNDPVDWAYEIWDDVVSDLRHENNRVRAIAAQVLCNLAKSDPEQRILADFPALLQVTTDERFVTARHCLQSLWKVGVAGSAQRDVYRDGMVRRFADCRAEKNWSLIRSDIVQSMRDVFDITGDETIRTAAQALIDSETDDKYRKKYAKVWKL